MDILTEVSSIGPWGIGLIISSLVLFLIGLPVQIYQNYKRKSIEGISLPLFLLYFAAYVIWLSYGLRIAEPAIIIPNAPAVFAAALLLLQFLIYKNKKS